MIQDRPDTVSIVKGADAIDRPVTLPIVLTAADVGCPPPLADFLAYARMSPADIRTEVRERMRRMLERQRDSRQPLRDERAHSLRQTRRSVRRQLKQEIADAIDKWAPALRMALARDAAGKSLNCTDLDLRECARRVPGWSSGTPPTRKSGRPRTDHEHLWMLREVESEIRRGEPKSKAKIFEEVADKFGQCFGRTMTPETVKDLYNDRRDDPYWCEAVEIDLARQMYEDEIDRART